MKISFNVQSQSLIDDPRLKPKPVQQVSPEWKSSIDALIETEEKTARTARACPALDDYLHLGFVIPLWSDMRLERVSVNSMGQARQDENGEYIRWRTAHGAFPIEFHGEAQVAGAEPLEPPFLSLIHI